MIELSLVDADQPCDLRVISRGMRAAGEQFVPLWDERYAVAMPAAHPLAGRRVLRAAELTGERLVARCHCENAARFAGAGKRFDVVAIAATEEWALTLVAAGVGIAIVPEGVAAGVDGLVVRPLQDRQARRQVGIAYGASGAPTPELERVIERVAARGRRKR
jgi:DNA-binding transcriptional LysR family regulator